MASSVYLVLELMWGAHRDNSKPGTAPMRPVGDGDLPPANCSESARYPSGGDMPPRLLPVTEEEEGNPFCHAAELLLGIVTELAGMSVQVEVLRCCEVMPSDLPESDCDDIA